MAYLQNKKIQTIDWGLIQYATAWEKQLLLLKEIVDIKLANRKKDSNFETIAPTPNYLIFCEHPHVYTLGKSGNIANLLMSEAELKAKKIDYFHIERGGDITYHGPGQIVGYPIIDLENFITDLHKYLRNIEIAIINTCAYYTIEAGVFDKYTGVWVDPYTDKARKIAAIGVKCSHWVSMHGFAFNINTDLSYFKNIIPCGIVGKDVTSLSREMGKTIDINEVKSILKQELKNAFGFDYLE